MTIHRIARHRRGQPSGYYFKWYSDPATDEIVAFERGPVRGGQDVVEQGEELEQFETLDEAPLHALDWRDPPALRSATPTPAPPTASATPTPKTPDVARPAIVTPTPTPTVTPMPARPSDAPATATPVPDPTFPVALSGR